MENNSENKLSAEERAIVEEEQAILEIVKISIDKEIEGRKSQLDTLRKQFEEAKEEVKGVRGQGFVGDTDLPMLMQTMDIQANLAKQVHKSPLPDKNSPYFARLALNEDGKIRNLLLGYVAFLNESGYNVIDWRNAPLARVFFEYREGEEFEQQLPRRMAEGTVDVRRIVSIESGKIVRIRHSSGCLECVDGQWISYKPEESLLAGGQGAAVRAKHFGTNRTSAPAEQIAALLDKKQYQAITLEPEIPLLVTGGAGAGKTTVAIHRIAQLNFLNRQKFSQNNIAVIAPEKGLIRLYKNLLTAIGLPNVRMDNFDDWVRKAALKAIPKMPRKICEDTPAEAVAIKRHPEIINAIDLYVSWRQETNPKWFDPEEFDIRSEHEQFFCHRDILAEGMKSFSKSEINALVQHTVYQHADAEFSDTHQGVDGQTLDWQTPTGIRNTIDIEDYAVLLEIYRRWLALQGLKLIKFPYYQKVVVDEGQELAPIELTGLKNSIKPETSVTIAGDSAQVTEDSSVFLGWDSTAVALGQEGYEHINLEVNYRSPEPIAVFADSLLGEYAKDRPKSVRTGPPVKRDKYPNFALAAIEILNELEELVSREPQASIAILCKNEEQVDLIWQGVGHGITLRLIEDGEFSFRPGIDLCTVEMAKGLEFDYVIMPDLHTYGLDRNARHTAYVGATRAMHQLWVISIGYSELLKKSK